MEERITWEDVYPLMDEVKAMARGLLRRESHAESIQTTGLVLSALRRLRPADQDWSQVTWPNRRYFFGATYRAIRRALIDHARSRATDKRGQELLVPPEDLELYELKCTLESTPTQVVALVEALEWLRQEEPRWAEMIEHRFYGGLTLEETARMMDVSERAIRRWWDRAQPLLRQKIVSLLKEEM